MSEWNVLRFSTDDLKDDPAYGRKTLVQMLDQWYGEDSAQLAGMPLYAWEIVRLAVRSVEPFTSLEVSELLGVSPRYARDLLRHLVQQRVLEAASGERRVRSYRLRRK